MEACSRKWILHSKYCNISRRVNKTENPSMAPSAQDLAEFLHRHVLKFFKALTWPLANWHRFCPHQDSASPSWKSMATGLGHRCFNLGWQRRNSMRLAQEHTVKWRTSMTVGEQTVELNHDLKMFYCPLSTTLHSHRWIKFQAEEGEAGVVRQAPQHQQCHPKLEVPQAPHQAGTIFHPIPLISDACECRDDHKNWLFTVL